MTHFTTFARLHDGHSDDIPALWALSDALPGGMGGERPIWQTLLQADDAHVIVATECQLVVGAIVTWHHKGAHTARIAWLGVAPSVRRRGVGQLLLETSIARAGLGGAGVMSTHVPPEAGDLRDLLQEAGFLQAKGGELRLPLGGVAL